ILRNGPRSSKRALMAGGYPSGQVDLFQLSPREPGADLRRYVDAPELAAHAAAPQAGEVRLARRSLAQGVRDQVIGRISHVDSPRQVVVPVDEDVPAQQLASVGQRSRRHRPAESGPDGSGAIESMPSP